MASRFIVFEPVGRIYRSVIRRSPAASLHHLLFCNMPNYCRGFVLGGRWLALT
jgi:hypothetical protein